MTANRELRHSGLDTADCGDRARGDVHGIVLCGGRSLRMGRDKALLELGATTLIEHAVATLSGVAESIVLACGPTDRYAHVGPMRVLDGLADGGPLAGLAAGMAVARAKWTIALACDMPCVTAEVLWSLVAAARARELDVCFLETDRGIEPLCGAWHARARASVRAALDAGERKVLAFERFPCADGRRPRVGTVKLAGPLDVDLAANLNTPDDLDRLREKLAGAIG